MRSKFFSAGALILISLFLMACQTSNSKTDKAAKLDPSRAEVKKIKDEIVDIIVTLPSNDEVVKLVNETGAAYLTGMTHENIQTDDYLTRSARSKAYGSVLFDMAYASTYNQVNVFSQLLAIHESLTQELGFEALLKQQEKYKVRFTDNKSNPDSVDHIVIEMLNETNKFLNNNGSPADMSLIFAGATTKSLYVISSITLFARDKEKLVSLLRNQKERIESALRVLELTSDDLEVQKMVENIKPVNELFASSEPFTIESVEKIQQLTEFIVR